MTVRKREGSRRGRTERRGKGRKEEGVWGEAEGERRGREEKGGRKWGGQAEGKGMGRKGRRKEREGKGA